MSSWKAVRLDDVEAIAWPYAPLTWRPVRSAVGGRIVGMGAFTAEQAGDEAAAGEALSRVAPRYREALRADPDLGPLVR